MGRGLLRAAGLDERAQPAHDDREADRRRAPRAREGRWPQGAARPDRQLPLRPRARRRRARRLPAPALRRHAPAGAGGGRGLREPPADPRRRADDGARRRGAEAHPADDGRDPAAAAQHAGAWSPTTSACTIQVTDRLAIAYAGKIVEFGPTARIFAAPSHPYTQALVAALPRIGEKRQRSGLDGRPPSLADPPPGCRFAARCPEAQDICRRVSPALEMRSADRPVACHFR